MFLFGYNKYADVSIGQQQIGLFLSTAVSQAIHGFDRKP
jgi:hypothetical protein